MTFFFCFCFVDIYVYMVNYSNRTSKSSCNFTGHLFSCAVSLEDTSSIWTKFYFLLFSFYSSPVRKSKQNFPFNLFVFFSVTESLSRHRRQYNPYGYNYPPQQQQQQQGVYNQAPQGWMNNGMNMNNPYPNQGAYNNWNNNLNWNQGNRQPEWYYNTSSTTRSSILSIILSSLLCVLII